MCNPLFTLELLLNILKLLFNLLFSFLVLASSLVFNLADGQFSSRADLVDAPGSSLGRGAQVGGLGKNQTF